MNKEQLSEILTNYKWQNVSLEETINNITGCKDVLTDSAATRCVEDHDMSYVLFLLNTGGKNLCRLVGLYGDIEDSIYNVKQARMLSSTVTTRGSMSVCNMRLDHLYHVKYSNTNKEYICYVTTLPDPKMDHTVETLALCADFMYANKFEGFKKIDISTKDDVEVCVLENITVNYIDASGVPCISWVDFV